MTVHSVASPRAPLPAWTRAIAISAAAFGVIVFAFFFVPHWILSFAWTDARPLREWAATAWIAAVFAGGCVAGWRATTIHRGRG
jgi:hypothetical protein